MNDRISKIHSFLKDNPKDCFLNHALALEYIKIGNDEEAKKHFLLNIETDVNYVATYYHLGKLLEREGLYKDALSIYEQGMEKAKLAKDMHTYNELQSAAEDI